MNRPEPAVTLEVLTPLYARRFFDTVDTNREYLMEWLTWPRDITDPQAARNVLTSMATLETDGRAINRAITTEEEFIGQISLFDIEKPKSAKIGYWVSESHAGRGIASRAVKMMLHIAFADIELERVILEADKENAPSNRIARSAGFSPQPPENTFRNPGLNFWVLDKDDYFARTARQVSVQP